MNREQQEMTLWRESYRSSHSFEQRERARDADAAVAQFRQRYPAEPAAPEPTAPAPVWYDEPPFPKDGSVSPVWLFDYPFPILVAYFGDGWAYEVPGRSDRWHPLAGRRVCPIVKPQEPTT